ncbi:MAG: NADPH:quinone oxidoreductase family protein [Pseudomonadota bacterium]
MRAFQVTEYGQPASLRDVERPQPGQGEVLIRIEACALNFADLLMIKGTYQVLPDLPFSPGMEVAGTIEAIGPDTDALPLGTRVAVYGGNGGLAELGCFPASLCVALPDSMDAQTAAAFQVAYSTSHVALDYRAGLQAGETLLVLGAAGGVGLTAVELGAQMGATVIAAARGADKLAVAKDRGAHHLIDTNTDDLRDVVKSLGGADVVYDPIGGDLFKAALRSCKPEARVLTIGFASGDVPQIAANHILVKNITVIGFYWGGYVNFKPKVLTDSLTRLFQMHAAGQITPHISHSLPIEQAAEALELLRSRKSTGKVVVTL